MKWSDRGFCNACRNCNFEHYDYEYTISGYYTCDREHNASGLSPFPFMRTPKNCNDFMPVLSEKFDSDYWGLLYDIEHTNGVKDRELTYQILNSIITFEKAMGSYNYGTLNNLR